MTMITLYFDRVSPSFDKQGASFQGAASRCWIDGTPGSEHDPTTEAISSVWWKMGRENPNEVYRELIANQGKALSARAERVSSKLAASEATMFATAKGEYVVHYSPERYAEAAQFIMAIAMAGHGLVVRLFTSFSISPDNPHTDQVATSDWIDGYEPLLCDLVRIFPWDDPERKAPILAKTLDS